MYEAFYGLRERPFDLTPNPRFLMMTPRHREVLSAIRYAMGSRKGFTLVVGPAGTGKTTLVHAALARQDEHTRAVYLANPRLTRDEFFEFLALELGLPPGGSKTQFLRDLRTELAGKHAAGIGTALIVDEGQSMPDDLLEELRLLENLETTTEKLLPVILVGQPELSDRLRQGSLQSLTQRIALRATLTPLTAEETASYVVERLRIAGADARTVFTADAVGAICESSAGIPRNVNVICDNALISGFALDQRPVTALVIAEVCRDFDLPMPSVLQSLRGFVAEAVGQTRLPDAAGGRAQATLTEGRQAYEMPPPVQQRVFAMPAAAPAFESPGPAPAAADPDDVEAAVGSGRLILMPAAAPPDELGFDPPTDEPAAPRRSVVSSAGGRLRSLFSRKAAQS